MIRFNRFYTQFNIISSILIIIFSPIIVIFSFLIWNQDKKSPFYVADRVGKKEKLFKMIKFRSMVINADKSGVDSTSDNDERITPSGQLLINYIIDEYATLDIAFNNAGVQGQMVPTTQTTIENWDKVLSVNARSVFYCMKKQLEIMCAQKKGVILNNASAAGLRGLPNGVAYSASKHAVVGMTKTAAMEYAKLGIRINALCPSFTV